MAPSSHVAQDVWRLVPPVVPHAASVAVGAQGPPRGSRLSASSQRRILGPRCSDGADRRAVRRGLPATDRGGRSCRPTSRSIHYTEQGVKTFKELSQCIEETKSAGETVAKLVGTLALAAGARGNVRTETMRAFTEEEARQIAAGLWES